MPTLTTHETARLRRLDEDLRREADRFLEASGIGPLLAEAGFVPVGSYAMRTMVWRDLDFERAVPVPDWAEVLALGARLTESGWAWRLDVHDEYRDPQPMRPGYYLGLRASDPAGGPSWKLDSWTARAEEFAETRAKRAEWLPALDEDTRLHILAIKDAVCRQREYGRSLYSVHVYQAVIEEGVRSPDDFMAWWQARYSTAG